MTETKVAHDCGAVRWLECPDCHFRGTRVENPNDCKECNGTGLRFLGLSRDYNHRTVVPVRWTDDDDNPFLITKTVHDDNCNGCGSRRRLPVDDEGAWLDVADSLAGSFWTLQPYRNGEGPLKYECYIAPEGTEEAIGTAPVRLDAIKQAICKAVGAHEEESDDPTGT